MTAVPGAPDPGPAPGKSLLATFGVPLRSGFALTGDHGLHTGFAPSISAPPAGDSSQYFYVSSALGFEVTFEIDNIAGAAVSRTGKLGAYG